MFIGCIGKRIWFFETEADKAPKFYLNFKEDFPKKCEKASKKIIKLYLYLQEQIQII